MSRWIDADALKESWKEIEIDGATLSVIYGLLKSVDEAPSIDIVRCKECRHRNERCGMGEHRWCEILNMSTTPDDYCSYGQRKESE